MTFLGQIKAILHESNHTLETIESIQHYYASFPNANSIFNLIIVENDEYKDLSHFASKLGGIHYKNTVEKIGFSINIPCVVFLLKIPKDVLKFLMIP